ncbi:glucose-6-phosphate isomerase [Candidatus Vecturithrix granuli]|uniref:Glucose-6-phosphate isomerase n=1 Tax=Vecturithrix granuli TaxID=1499967 RepID=A0A081C7G1_VECG1|nr:glucose-6-phosphate isomerase [Candidatus Vecturithrix granuli]
MENLVSVITDFDLKTGLSKRKQPLRRYLSNMKRMFFDETAYNQQVSPEDTLVYEFLVVVKL